MNFEAQMSWAVFIKVFTSSCLLSDSKLQNILSLKIRITCLLLHFLSCKGISLRVRFVVLFFSSSWSKHLLCHFFCSLVFRMFGFIY